MKRIWTYVIGALFLAGSVLLILNPEHSLADLVYYVGIVLLITGILKIISSIVNKVYFTLGSSFISGIWNFIFGVLLISNADSTIKIIPVLIGLWLIITSVSGLIMMFNFRLMFANRNTQINTRMLFTSILKLVLGIIVLTTPIISIVFSGVFLGIVLVVIGIVTITSYKDDDSKVYKVKVK